MAAVGVFAILVGIATAVTVNQRSSAEESALKSDMVAAATALESWLLSVNGRPEVELAIATATDGWAASTFSETVLSGPVAPGSTLTGRVTAGNGLYCFVGTRGDFSFVMSSLDPRPVEGTSCDAVLGTAPDGADAGLPAAPGTVSATAGPNVGDVAVTWQGTVGALEYSVTVPGQAAALVSAPAITTTLTGIPAGTHYVTVRARNDVGWGPRTTSNRITIGAEAPPSGIPSGEATPGPTQDRPAAPTDLTAASDPSSLSVALTWNAPVDDGGSPIIDYIVQYRSTPSGSWRNFTDGAATATTATVTDLALNDVAYEFRVRAVNAIGNGTWSNVATTGTLSFQGAPTGLVATAGNQQVSLSWNAANGGLPITDYVIEYRTTDGPGEWQVVEDGTSTVTTATVTGLTNGTSYDFRVSAVRNAGPGDASNIATATPRPDPPAAPSALAGTPGNQQVSLSWDAPVDEGGSPVSDYLIQYRTTPSGPWTVFEDATSTATSAVVTGLTNGTTYDFQVAAVNGIGNGTWSATVTATPSAPLSLSGYSTVQLVTGVAMSAQTPTVSGGLGSNTYTVNPALPNGLTLDTSTGAISGTPTAAQAATVHTVTVTDATSGQTAPATISVAVQAPMNFTTGYSDASLVTGAAMVTQTPQVANGYGTKTYSISPAVPAGLSFDTSTGALSGTPTDPQDQTLYTVTVTDSAAPEPFTATAPVRLDIMVAHPAPTGLTASTGVSRQMDLTWNAVAGADSTSLRQYTVRYRTSAGTGPWITATDTVQERPWTPADLSTGAALWLDANDASSFTITDGRVEEWRDRSGNNRHVRQNTASARPVREANLVNGKAAVRWDGSYRSLRTTTNLTLNDFDLFVVFRDTGTQEYERLVDHDYVSGFWLGRDTTAADTWRSGVREATNPHGRAVNLPDGQWHLIQSGRAGTQHTIRGNGGTGVTGTVDGTATANGPLALGGYANGTTSQYLVNGDIAEVILVPAALGVQDRQRLEGYLAHRWGTTASLPADHPYRTTVPTAESGFTATVTGLVNGTSYDFQVAATSPAGTGAYAAVSATPLSPPEAPATLTATPGDRQVSLSWQPPTDTGGTPILDYRVEYRTSPNGLWLTTASTTLTSTVITGLVNGVAYDFRVAARNTTGTGTDASATESPRTVPGAPTNLAATAGSSQVTLTWGAPTNSGGSPVTGYAIQYATAGSQAWTTLIPGMIPVTVQERPWTPADLSTGAALWLDANDASSFTITDGRVEEWRDRSGNNRHVRQNTASARPVREANLVNGKAAVRWDGFYRSLRTTTNLTLNDFDVFVVFRDTGAQSYERLVDHDFTNGFWLGRDTAAATWRSGVREASPPYGRTVNLPDGQWHLIQSSRAGNQHTIRGNGGTGVTGTVSNLATTNGPVGIGSWFNGSTQQSLINGDIAEVILVPAALGVEDRQRLEGYLAHRWGTTASLPADHPYRTTVPTGLSGFTATVTGLVNDTSYDFQVAAVNSAGTGTYSSPVIITAGGAPSTFDPTASGELAGALLFGK